MQSTQHVPPQIFPIAKQFTPNPANPPGNQQYSSVLGTRYSNVSAPWKTNKYSKQRPFMLWLWYLIPRLAQKDPAPVPSQSTSIPTGRQKICTGQQHSCAKRKRIDENKIAQNGFDPLSSGL
jgi:hypothetical protein